MYVPKHFQENDVETLAGYMRSAPFATLITSVDGVPFATHLPVSFAPTNGELGTISGHLSRGNDHWKALQEGVESLVVFNGPNAFISANWMNSANALPTWNYAAVHAYGQAQIIVDEDRYMPLLQKLNDEQETEATGSWTPAKMDQAVLNGMLKGIVPFEIPVRRLEGKRKMSQNKSEDIQRAVIDGLRTAGDPASLAVADDMEGKNTGR